MFCRKGTQHLTKSCRFPLFIGVSDGEMVFYHLTIDLTIDLTITPLGPKGRLPEKEHPIGEVSGEVFGEVFGDHLTTQNARLQSSSEYFGEVLGSNKKSMRF